MVNKVTCSLVLELRQAASNGGLGIGEAWELLDRAANALEESNKDGGWLSVKTPPPFQRVARVETYQCLLQEELCWVLHNGKGTWVETDWTIREPLYWRPIPLLPTVKG